MIEYLIVEFNILNFLCSCVLRQMTDLDVVLPIFVL